MTAQQSVAGGAAVKISGDRSPLRQALNDAKQDLQKFGQDVGRIGLSMGVAGGGALLPLRQAVSDFATAEQALGRFKSVMGDALVGPANDFAQMMAKKVNTSVWTVRDSVAQLMALFKGAGFNDEQAFNMTTMMAQSAQDLLAFDDQLADSQEAVNKLRSGLMGEIQPVIAYGADVRVAKTEEELRKLGITFGKTANLQQQLVGRMKILTDAFKRSGIIGQAAKEVETLSARFRGLRAAIWDLSIATGAALAPVVGPLIAMITDVVRAFQGWIEKNTTLVRVVGFFAAAMFLAGGALAAIGAAIAGVAGFISFAASGFGSLVAGAYSVYRVFRLLGVAITKIAVPAMRLLIRTYSGAGGIMRAVATHMLGAWKLVAAGLAVVGTAIVRFGSTAMSAMKLFGAQILSGDVSGAIDTLRTLVAVQFATISTSIRYYLAIAADHLAGFGVAVRYAFATAANYAKYYWSQLVNVLEATGVLDVFRSIWPAAQAAAQAFWTWIVDAATSAFEVIKQVAENPILFLGLLWEELSARIAAGFQWLVSRISTIFATITGVIAETGAAIGSLLTNAFVTAVAVVLSIWEGLVSFIMFTVESMATVFKVLWGIIGAGVAYVASQFGILGSAIWSTLTMIGEGLWALLADTFEGVVQGLKDAWYGLVTFLSDTFAPVIDGFANAWSWLSDQFTRSIDLMSDAWESFWGQSLTQSLLDFQELAGQTFLYLMSLWDDSFDLDGAMQELNREFNARRKDAEQASAAAEGKKNDSQEIINQEARAAMDLAKQEAANRRAAALAERDAAAARMAGLKGEFDARRAKLAEEEAAKQQAADKFGPGVVPPIIDPNSAEGGIEVSTGFVNSALQKAMGVGDTVSQSIAGNTAATAKNTEQINKAIANIQQRAGQ